MRNYSRGVTLMELIVVMAIVGLLAAIAIPTYRQYAIRANRADAKAALLSAAGALERCFTQFNSYDAADGCAVVFPVGSTNGNYQISAPTQTAIAFALTATPQGRQIEDTDCGNFTLNSANVRGVSGTKTAQQCWSH
jgi:type IV pilus assembly protein PilE